ncbi:MAG: PAS domain-containing sensor histidine kinase [Campylobacteraceae bacterium]|jgi:PAS domain S-box-containing protein|nr:PAS domain-containing sensor histidine kinase [Campylobacteraceae bacterium]
MGRRELEQYKRAVEQSNIVSKTDINGIITFVNEEFCKISGYSKEELIGKNHNIVRHPGVPKKNFRLLWNTILKKETFKTTAKNRAKDGSTFYVNTTITPILNENGDIEEFIAIRYDVTDNVALTEALKKKEKELSLLNSALENRVKEQTKELRELNQNLERRIAEETEKNREKDRLMFQQARLAAMGETISNIAHQWRQPLSELGIIIFTMKKYFTDKNEKGIEKQYEHAKKVITKMSKTIEDFRNFSNPDKEKSSFSVKNMIEDTLSILKGSLRKAAINIEVDIDEHITAYGYKNELSQAVLNLISNAKDALLDKLLGEKTLKISSTQNDNFTTLSIADNAGGIDDAAMDKIFEPYFTTKHANLGTGLGLYIVKTIIESSMNGNVCVKNENGGANFIIKIPAKEKIHDE